MMTRLKGNGLLPHSRECGECHTADDLCAGDNDHGAEHDNNDVGTDGVQNIAEFVKSLNESQRCFPPLKTETITWKVLKRF